MDAPPIPSPDHNHDRDQNCVTQNPNSTQHQLDQENPPPPPPPLPPCIESQPPETLNLDEDDQTLQNTDLLDSNGDDQNQDDPYAFNETSPPQQDTLAAVCSSVARRGPKRKKGGQKRRAAHERKNRWKLEALLLKIKPIPFVPAKALDFASHEKLLRRLGLWDFVHLEFDSEVRVDLVAQLIANFSSFHRASYVNGVRIALNRADMARALRLPPPPGKKDKGAAAAAADGVAEASESEESIAFVEDLVFNWMLLHEDTWMLPEEVIKLMNVIKEGHLEKVEWGTLIWFMVEKELTAAPNLENCYFASHLQCLIKSQREELFREGPKAEADVKEEEQQEQEAVDVSGDVKMVDASDDFQVSELEEHKIELNLGGQDNVVKDDEEKEYGEGNVEKDDEEKECWDGNVERDEDDDEQECFDGDDGIDFEECKGEEQVQWFLGGKNNAGERYLQRCNLGEIKDSGFEEEKGMGEEQQQEDDEEEEEEEEEEDPQDGGFHLSPNALSSDNLIQALDAAQNHFGSGLQLHHPSSGDFLSSRGESHIMSDGPSLFGNGHKRGYGNENTMSHGGVNGNSKRLRSDGSFDNKSDDFFSCIDQVQHLLGKAKMMYETKEHAFAESSMHQQFLLNELQQRENVIHTMHTQRLAEQHKRDVHTLRLERELLMMRNLLQNYRKALKETQKAFAEYRAQYPQPEEPLYRDVPGSGGLVLSATELEKQHLKQLEEVRLNQVVIEKVLNDFAAGWTATFDGHHDAVHLLESKLLAIGKEVEILKELSLKSKVSTLPELTECTSKEC